MLYSRSTEYPKQSVFELYGLKSNHSETSRKMSYATELRAKGLSFKFLQLENLEFSTKAQNSLSP